MTARRVPIFGPEPWAQLGGAVWSHWDRWYCAVCTADFGGDWEALAEGVATRSGRAHPDPDAAAKLSHLDDLVERLEAAGLGPDALAGDVDKATRATARRKVLDQALSSRHRTPAMRWTPERRLRQRALRGSWPALPVDPSGDYAQLEGVVEEAEHVGRSGGLGGARDVIFELARELEDDIADGVAVADGDPARLLAARRAALTAVQEVAHRVDDSFGVVGELGKETWAAYVATPWRGLVTPEVYWRDIAELVAFDDHAHLHRNATLPWRQARKSDLPLICAIVTDLVEDYGRARLRHQADEVRVAAAYAHVATRSLTGYAEVAGDLGSAHWMPIIALAESALRSRRPDVAAAVFDAADQPGRHRDHLRKRRTEFLGRPGDTPRAGTPDAGNHASHGTGGSGLPRSSSRHGHR
jgi:hypothetical protein